MLESPTIVQTTAQHTAALHLTVSRMEMASVMGPGIAEVVAAISAQGIPMTGPWFAHHLSRPTDNFDFEICFPIASPISPAGRVYPSQWPGMKVARALYCGPYDGLPAAWSEFTQWIAAGQHTEASDLWERYLVNPNDNPDPAAWRTELNRQILD